MSEMQLKQDANRIGIGETGIFVRALNTENKIDSVDISELDKESLLGWLRSRGGDNKWAEDTVGIILGHGHLHTTPPEGV